MEPNPATAPVEDDAAIVARVLAGELDAFELLMRRHNQRLFRAARSVLGRDAEAEDAVQEAYIAAFTRLSSLQEPRAFAMWATRITLNEAHGRIRRRGEVGRRSDTLEDGEVFEATSQPQDPDRVAEAREVCRIVERAIDELPEAYRTVLVLRAIEGMPVAETAACLEIAEETVKTRLFRARAELEKILRMRAQLSLPALFSFGFARCDRIVERVLERLRRQRQQSH